MNDLGEKVHTVASEPFFYDTAYTPQIITGAIPVDEYGWCCIATEISSRDKKSQRPRKWRCTEQCKVPEKEQVSSILAVKAWFHEPIEHLRKLLDSIDEGCEHDTITAELTWKSRENCLKSSKSCVSSSVVILFRVLQLKQVLYFKTVTIVTVSIILFWGHSLTMLPLIYS